MAGKPQSARRVGFSKTRDPKRLHTLASNLPPPETADTAVHFNHSTSEQDMPRSLAQIKNQIERLQSEAKAIQEKERAEVIERIQTAINHYALTADDLFAAKRSNRSRLRGPVALKATINPNSRRRAGGKGEVPAKYRDQAGNSWTGRGRRPKWLVAALAEGKLLDEFAL